MTNQEKIQWCIDQHKNTNHYYDQYLPYEFHLRMVVQAANNFINICENSCEGDIDYYVENIILASWGHNEKGKNRNERANDKYYEGIRETDGAVFVKLCDRIANVQYSKMTKSRMFEMYKKENVHFMDMLGWNGSPTHVYFKMFQYLIKLFED